MGDANKGGISLFKKEIPLPCTLPEKIHIAGEQLEELQCLPIALPARGGAAFEAAIRFASAPTTRCCSAHLVEVRSNLRLPRHYSMRRAPAMPLFRKQSAAEVTSLAPHDSKARLISVTTCRRFMAKPCTPHPIAQRVQSFKLQTRNGGVKGRRPLRSLGGPRGPFSHVREWPPFPYPPRVWGKCPTTYKWSISAHSTVYISSRCRRGRDRCGRSSGPCGAAFSPCRRRRWRRRCRRPRARA